MGYTKVYLIESVFLILKTTKLNRDLGFT
jgi:hypothetical protein